MSKEYSALFLFSMQFDKFSFLNPKRKKEKEKVAGDLVRKSAFNMGKLTDEFSFWKFKDNAPY